MMWLNLAPCLTAKERAVSGKAGWVLFKRTKKIEQGTVSEYQASSRKKDEAAKDGMGVQS